MLGNLDWINLLIITNQGLFFRCEGVAPVPIIGDRDWLDGFTDSNQPDLLLISTERQYVTLHHLSQNNKL